MLVTRPAKVSTYDFRRPNKLNREHVRALEIVGETFARQLTTALGTALRTGVTTSLDDIHQYTYDEYVRELPSPTLLSVLDLPPLKGTGMLHLPPSLTMDIVDRLLGGTGTGTVPNRAMTEIELRLLTDLLDRVLARLGVAFESLAPVRPQLNRTESNPQFAQVTAPTDMVVVTSLTVKVDGNPSAVTLAVPFTALAPVLAEATSRDKLQDDHLAGEVRRALEQNLHASGLAVRARFREITLPSSRIASLRPGDVLPLDQPVDEPLTVDVAGLPRFRATAGTKGKRVACLVTETIEGVRHP
jgi:flagellar motor switch protein FliM